MYIYGLILEKGISSVLTFSNSHTLIFITTQFQHEIDINKHPLTL